MSDVRAVALHPLASRSRLLVLLGIACASCALAHERTDDASTTRSMDAAADTSAMVARDASEPTDAVVAIDAPRSDASTSCADEPPLEWTADGTYAETGHRYDFAPVGPVALIEGHSGSAFSFRGAGHLEAPNVPGGLLDRLDRELTVEAWVRLAYVPASARIVDKITVGTGDGFLLDVSSARFRLIAGDVATEDPTTVPTGRWVHVAGTFDGAYDRMYIDGVMTSEMPVLVRTVAHNTLPLRLGADSTNLNVLTGDVDDVRIHCRALPPEEIARHAAM